MSFLESLQLQNFRNYAQADLRSVGQSFVVLYGSNGAGKTNILEAVSLLSPGRGLRGARMAELQNKDYEQQPWAVAGSIESSYGTVQLGTGLDPHKDKRTIRIQGENASQTALADYFRCVWLTPQMDGLFIDASSARRRFFDRLILTYDPGHAGRVTRYENAMRQRSRLLQEGQAEPAWLTGLEATMAESGVAIAAARQDFSERLQKACEQAHKDSDVFPLARLRVAGTVEELLLNAPALEVEDLFRHQLQQSRRRDAETGGAATGPHKTDLVVYHAAKSMPADHCSTGEQKALLIGIILGHARLIAAAEGMAPVLLLDEVAAHLDAHRRKALYKLLDIMKGQVWLTGVDMSLFEDIDGPCSCFEIAEGQIHLQTKSEAA